MAKGFARGRNAPVAQSEIRTEVREEVNPKIERSFESSRLEGTLLAVAYEALVPVSTTPSSHDTLERLQKLAAAAPAGLDTFARSAPG